MSSAFPPEIAAILDRYSVADLLLPGSRGLNRELGALILTEVGNCLQTGDNSPESSAAEAAVHLFSATAFVAQSSEAPRAPGVEIEIEDGNLVIRLDEDEPDRRRQNLLTFIIASQMEREEPTVPMDREVEQNPYQTLDAATQLTRHITYLSDNQPTLMAKTKEAANQLGAPLHPIASRRCMVAIPVAGHQEQENIFRTLEQYARQDMRPEEYEVILGINMPAGMSAETTIAEVERFKQEYPAVAVRYFVQVYDGDKPIIGQIRSDIWNTLAFDALQQDLDHDILIVSGDADAIHLNRSYLSDMTHTFETTGADIVTAQLRWQMAPGLPYDAPVNKMLRWQTFLDNVRDRHSWPLHTSDANTGLSLATYCAVGGFDRLVTIGEMYDISMRIRDWRLQSKGNNYWPTRTVEAKAHNAWLKTHSRRVISIMALGHHPYDAWDQELLTFGSDDSLRTEAMQVTQANRNAAQHLTNWTKQRTEEYLRDVPSTKRQRLLAAARHIIGLE